MPEDGEDDEDFILYGDDADEQEDDDLMNQLGNGSQSNSQGQQGFLKPDPPQLRFSPRKRNLQSMLNGPGMQWGAYRPPTQGNNKTRRSLE